MVEQEKIRKARPLDEEDAMMIAQSKLSLLREMFCTQEGGELILSSKTRWGVVYLIDDVQDSLDEIDRALGAKRQIKKEVTP